MIQPLRRFLVPLCCVFAHTLACIAATASPLQLVAPNGGERYRVGSSATIRWTGAAATDTVKLEYSIDNGTTWTLITDQATGLQYVWSRVPNTPSNRCLMRVSMGGTIGDSILYLRATRPGFFIPDAVHHAEFSPDGAHVIGGGADGDVFIWDAITGGLLQVIPVELRSNIPSPPATAGITLIAAVRYSPDGKYFATTGPLPDSSGAMVRIFDAATGTKLRQWRDVGPAAVPGTSPCVYSPDGTRLLVAGVGRGTIYDVATGTELVRLKGYTSPSVISSMVDADWSRDGSFVIGALTNGPSTVPDIIVSDPVTGDTIHTFKYAGSGDFSSIRLSPDGKRFITTADNGAARVCDVATGALIYDIHDYVSFPTTGAFSHGGQYFATGGQDDVQPVWKLRLYDGATGAFVRLVGAIAEGMRTLDFSPDNSRALVACVDGVRIFHAPLGTFSQSDVSDSLWTIYADSGAVVMVSAPTLTAASGQTIEVPITVSDPAAALGAGATRIDVSLRYNATLLDPVGGTPRGTVNGNERSIALSLPLLSAVDSVIGRLQFRAALGNDSTTVLDLFGAVADNANVAVSENDGLFRLSNLCRAGGARLLNPNGIVALKLVSSDRVTDHADVELETVEDGTTRLTLFDLAGRQAQRFLDEPNIVGRHVLRLDMGSIPQGRYFLVLETPTVRKSLSLEVVR
ncbi:MAG: hypothetical protein JST22_05460 [Bacteroidetes bacterium]|nr:hypothetical protein [Bacteroidota bacterium]